MKNKKYISVDIEASGSSPGKYSMLSLGACVVGETDLQFYSELKPISFNFKSMEAMRVGCSGLYALREVKKLPLYDVNHDDFNPRAVLDFLDRRGEHPENAMKRYEEWVLKVTKNYTPIQAAAPAIFDLGFTTYYFDNFNNEINPFGFGGEDMNSMARGRLKKIYSSMKTLNVKDTRKNPHNALEDAIYQAQEFEVVLNMMKRK